MGAIFFTASIGALADAGSEVTRERVFFSAERVCIYKALSRSPGYFFIWTKRRKTLRENIFVPKPIFVTSTLWNVDVSSDFAMHTCVRITKS